jgi:hypothetical protein
MQIGATDRRFVRLTPDLLMLTLAKSAFLLPIVALAPSKPAAAQTTNVIVSTDFAGTRRDGLSSTVLIRRGGKTTVQIIKDLIDLVPFDQVSMLGGGTLDNISNGRTQNGQGMGFISMDITLPSARTVGALFTVKVGLIDRYTFKVVHRGEVASITRTPDPSTIAVTTPWVAAVQGTDIGDVIIRPINCHTINHAGRTANAVTVTLTRSATCNTTAYGVALGGTTGNDAPNYRNANGQDVAFQFQYAPAGVACVSQPSIGATTIRQPQTSQVLQFRPATSSPTNVTIAWDSLTNGTVPAPNNEWLVTEGNAAPIGAIGGIGNKGFTRTVRGLSTRLSLAIPGTYRVTIKAKNCGQSAPAASVTFSLAYQ